MQIVFATGNMGKLKEAQEILGDNYKIMSSKDVGITEDIPETGTTLKENSVLKANYIANHCQCNCFADDTGLEVDILEGAPGVYSARYAGDNASPIANMDKLLAEIAHKEQEASMAKSFGLSTYKIGRKARFKTVITLILNGTTHYFEGCVEGVIGYNKIGANGFGYDPVFIPNHIVNNKGELTANEQKLTMAQLTHSQKNNISHRGKALKAMAEYIKTHEGK